jgi:xanthine dehydrogenase YagR molybdenum-binding subunit
VSAATGEPHSRVDGPAKVTGATKYAVEFSLPDLAHGAIVGSTIAKGGSPRSTARRPRAPGVLAVITHANAPKLPYRRQRPTPPVDPEIGLQIPVLQDDLVRHNGQYVALVVAETLEQATYAADLVRVAYDEEPAATSVETALAHAFPVIEANEGGGTTASYRGGDPVRALATLPPRSTAPTSSPARITIRSKLTPRSPPGVWCCTTRPSGPVTSAAASRSRSASRRRTSGCSHPSSAAPSAARSGPGRT